MTELQNTASNSFQTDPIPRMYQPNFQMALYQQNPQADIQKEMQLSSIRVNESLTKTYYAEQRRTEEYERRLKRREEAKERQRAIVELIEFTDDGQLLVCTRNTSVQAQPRIISNMRKPFVTIFQCMDSDESPCFLLTCIVGKEEQYIFLSSYKLTQGNYLIGKLSAAGIYFTIKPTKIKFLLIQMIAVLVENCENKRCVPETAGWTKMSNGYKFYSEEDLTWNKIKTLCK